MTIAARRCAPPRRLPAFRFGRTGASLRAGLMLSLSALILASCIETRQTEPPTVDQNTLSGKVERAERDAPETAAVGGEPAEATPETGDAALKRPFEERVTTGDIPTLLAEADRAGDAFERAPAPEPETVNAAVPPLKLPEFIDVVFGEMLQVPYSTGPEVAERTDVIQLRSSGRMPAQNFLSLVSTALREYGVVVAAADGLYQIIEEESARQRRPRFLRARSGASTPSDLRPVVQLVELDAISAPSMQTLLRQGFPQNSDLQIQIDRATGSLVLVGLPEDVEAAVRIIDSLDELRFADSSVIQFQPTYWNAEALATQLEQVLRSEGWQVSSGDRNILPIHIIPIAFSNTVLVFTKRTEASVRVRYWLDFLDKPSEAGDVDQIFVYDVENTDATVLAKTANDVLGQTQGAFSQQDGQDQSTSDGAASGNGNQSGTADSQASGRLVVDTQGNRIIFSGSPSDYQRVLPLLRRLDTPTPEVLIEVTVAEITLTDTTEYGVNFFVENAGGDDLDVDFGTSQSLQIPGSGLSAAFVTGDVSGALNAFASNQQVNILSTPRLVARSGGAANIQVGQDIPVITSQQASDVQGPGGETDILQQVQFRSTGVLLNIEPIVYGKNRVDLTVTQEVSSSLGASGAIASPTIQNRNLTTQLTLEDGATAVLGGLIQDDVSRDQRGVPFLKDIPGLGRLFSVDEMDATKTELLVIITAYIIRNKEDKQRFVDYLTEQINDSLADPLKLRTRVPEDPL